MRSDNSACHFHMHTKGAKHRGLAQGGPKACVSRRGTVAPSPMANGEHATKRKDRYLTLMRRLSN